MADIESMKTGVTRANFEISGSPVWVDYDRDALTPRVEGELDSLIQTASFAVSPFVIEFLDRIVVDWNLHFRKKKLGRTMEALQDVPSWIIQKVFEGISEDASVDPPSGGTSEGG